MEGKRAERATVVFLGVGCDDVTRHLLERPKGKEEDGRSQTLHKGPGRCGARSRDRARQGDSFTKE